MLAYHWPNGVWVPERYGGSVVQSTPTIVKYMVPRTISQTIPTQTYFSYSSSPIPGYFRYTTDSTND